MKGRAKLSVSVGDLQGNEFLDEYSGGPMSSRAYSKFIFLYAEISESISLNSETPNYSKKSLKLKKCYQGDKKRLDTEFVSLKSKGTW